MTGDVGILGVPDWTTYAPRQVPARSARQRVSPGPMYEEVIGPVRPYTGVEVTGVDTVLERSSATPASAKLARRITAAACEVLAELDERQRGLVTHDIDAVEWQHWINTHPNVMRHGLLMEDLAQPQRERVLELMRASLSEDGYAQARDIMRINGLLVDITGRSEEFGEWPYFFSIFGQPGAGAPWGWQLEGHHLVLNVVVVDGHVVTSPTFMGSEPCAIRSGRLAGTEVLREEHEAGLRLMRSLRPEQVDAATVRPSILTADLPVELTHLINGRTLAGPFRDNIALSHQGLLAADLDPGQRRLLLEVIGTYLRWSPDVTAEVRKAMCAEVVADTSFTWMGPTTEAGPFYYRVLSPAVLIEFDHHAGTVFDNPDPTPNHIHTMVRTPRRGDYGVDLIQLHHDRYDHSNGGHRPWT